jgi:hypothetical protein
MHKLRFLRGIRARGSFVTRLGPVGGLSSGPTGCVHLHGDAAGRAVFLLGWSVEEPESRGFSGGRVAPGDN